VPGKTDGQGERSLPPEILAIRDAEGRLEVGRKDPRFWPAVGVILDVSEQEGARVSEAAARLGTTTGQLISFLQIEPKVWAEINHLRSRFGLKPLHSGS
jgi:hypothetical protein